MLEADGSTGADIHFNIQEGFDSDQLVAAYLQNDVEFSAAEHTCLLFLSAVGCPWMHWMTSS
ncbi:hypothetical protein BOO71_0012112 [Deinococcus marmoris]|uniref:Uncharacterized protein n=1 Tax=Deinococcus marmoris TaxID=249408 RepID=A0A1U7NTU9_9DEIO|nr:hypothetical protein BOO71_0012112 [Deinococcus marmoris]